MYKKYFYGLLFSLMFFSMHAFASDRTESRDLFWQARESLLSKHYQQFERLKSRLKNYPLYPYLVYMKLMQRLAYQNEDEINDFLDRYQDTPLANRLRANYLARAAKKRDWLNFIHYYRPIYGPLLQCHYINALLATQQKQSAFEAIPELWLTLNSPPYVCRNVFSQWERAGVNRDLVWEKLEQTIQGNNTSLMRRLSRFLTREEQQQVKLWYTVHRHPYLVKQKTKFNLHDPIDRKILLYGMRRLAVKAPNDLAKSWPNFKKNYDFTEAEEQKILQELAIALARRADSAAGEWLKQIKSPFTNSVLRKWRVRHELLKKNWVQVLYWIDHLSASEQKLPCWRYWRARALVELHQSEKAKDIYKSLAKEVDYYGVLASQRLKQTYHPAIERTIDNPAVLQHNAAIQRAKELYALGFIGDARREWQWALHDLSKDEIQAAAQLAKKWEWYDLAIIAAAKAHLYSHIKLRFPHVYRASVLSAARKSHLNSAWIWAIMRQESAFMSNARSSAGALGLMQIMPATGASLARSLNLRRVNLLDPELNIRLGTIYLRYLLKTFDGNATLATAAYNIGPTRIKNFQSLYGHLPRDVWVEILPWKETRDYIKSVSLARSIYGQI
jgi:soluble lytic murein transglycosylase